MSLARNLIVAAVAAVSFSSLSPFALGVATVYSDNFETDTSANYLVTVTKTATTANNGLPTSDAVFAYDYSQVGIPSAPHSTGGTTIGVRTRADELNGGTTADGSAVGAVSLVTKTISTLSNNYVVSVDVWGNYIGGSTGTIASDGPNTTTLALLGVGASGTSEESVNGSGGEIYGTTQDGGSTTDYRAYLKGVRAVATSGTYAAGNDAQSEKQLQRLLHLDVPDPSGADDPANDIFRHADGFDPDRHHRLRVAHVYDHERWHHPEILH